MNIKQFDESISYMATTTKKTKKTFQHPLTENKVNILDNNISAHSCILDLLQAISRKAFTSTNCVQRDR